MPETLKLDGMNEAQRQAVLHKEGPVLLLAGPGSGKTFTIAGRILCLLERGVPPESILVITFMKEAALSMQERFFRFLSRQLRNFSLRVLPYSERISRIAFGSNSKDFRKEKSFDTHIENL